MWTPSSTLRTPACWAEAAWMVPSIVPLARISYMNAGCLVAVKRDRRKSRVAIHTVGPVWQDGSHGESGKLASCYRSSLELAAKHGISSIAFPCISTGVYGYPSEAAAEIAIQTVEEFFSQAHHEMDVTFCCFSSHALNVYQQYLTS